MHNRDCIINSSCGWSCSLGSWTGPWLPRVQPARLPWLSSCSQSSAVMPRQGGPSPPFPVPAAIAHRQNSTIFRKMLHSLCYIKKDSLFQKFLFYVYDHLLFKKITVSSFFLDITGSQLHIQWNHNLGKWHNLSCHPQQASSQH